MNKSIFNALNFYFAAISNSLQEDIMVMNDIYEHPEFSTENDLEGIISEYGNKIRFMREMKIRMDILVSEYDEHLKNELAYKLKSFKEKREKFKDRAINEDAEFNVKATNFSLHDIDDRK